MKLDHVAVAVRDLESAIDLWGKMLGGTYKQGVADHHAFSALQLEYDNGARVELMTPGSDPGSFLRRFLDKRGEGMHHMTFMVEDLPREVERFKERAYRVVGEDYSDPHWMEAFISPPSAHGVLVQLAQSDLTQAQQDQRFGHELDRVLAAAVASARAIGTPGPYQHDSPS